MCRKQKSSSTNVEVTAGSETQCQKTTATLKKTILQNTCN